MIKDDADFLSVGMKAYDNPSCVTTEEFNLDLSQYIYIKKNIKKYLVDDTNLRRLVNMVVVYYNCFGSSATDLLLYKVPEQEFREILLPIMTYLGWYDDQIASLNCPLNISVINQLVEL
jgi:hypothetical protein